MADDFIRELQVRWTAQPVDGAAVVARLRQGRATPRLLLWLEVVQGVVGVVFGLVFVWLALDAAALERWVGPLVEGRFSSPEALGSYLATLCVLLGAGGVVMLASVPPLAWAAIAVRRETVRWEDETPESVLRAGLRRADGSLRANRIGRLHAFVLLAFVLGLWALPAFGAAPVFLVASLTLVYLVTIAMLWIWLDLRRERLRRELETCLALLQDYEAERDAA